MLAEKLKHLNPAEDPFHDFRNFAWYVFANVLKLPDPDMLQYMIMAWMCDLPMGEDGIRRGQVQALRGCGKSVIFCIYCCWLWYCNPTIRCCLITSNGPKAEESAGLVKQILDSCDLLEHLRPDPDEGVVMRHGKKIRGLKTAVNQAMRFDVRGAGPGKDPSFACYPLFGGWTGSHPDFLGMDDIEIPENSGTPAKRQKILAKTREAEPLIQPGGTILFMGTPQTEESVYFELKRRGYAIRKWPSELPDPTSSQAEDVCPWLLDRVSRGEAKPGDPSYPERFPAVRLLEIKGQGMAYYALQYLLDPSYADSERFPLKLRDLIVFDAPSDCAPTSIYYGGYIKKIHELENVGFKDDYFCGPGSVSDVFEPYSDKLMYIDPKGGGADSVGWAVVGVLNGIVYLLAVGSHAVGTAGGTSDATMEALARTGMRWGVKKFVVESNWGGSKEESAYARLFQPVAIKWCGQCAVETNYVTGQKEVRILDTLEPLVGQHRLVVSTACCKTRGQEDPRRTLMWQMTHLQRERGCLGHDDEIDAVHGAVSKVMSHTTLDPARREAERALQASYRTAKEWDEETRKRGIPFEKRRDRWREQRRAERLGPRARGRWAKT